MYSPSRNASSIRKNAPETMSRTSVCEPKPIATPTTLAPASSGRMSTPSAARKDIVAITTIVIEDQHAQQRQQRLQAGGGHIRSLLAFGRQPPVDRRLRELPQQVGEQQHDADAEERARDLAAHARLRHGEQVDVPELREQEEAEDRHHDVDGAAKHRLVGRDESRRGGTRGGRRATRRPRRPGTASCRRSAATPPAARSGCPPPIRPACRRGCRRSARRRSRRRTPWRSRARARRASRRRHCACLRRGSARRSARAPATPSTG